MSLCHTIKLFVTVTFSDPFLLLPPSPIPAQFHCVVHYVWSFLEDTLGDDCVFSQALPKQLHVSRSKS